MLELVRNAGPFGYLIIFAGAAGITLALVTVVLAISPKTIRASVMLAGVLMGLGASTVLLGVTGRIAGRMATFRAVANVAPDYREQIIAKGFEEASANTTLGGMFGGPLAVLGAAVLGAAFARKGGAS